ncbi:MAG: hypothetical protein LUE27_09185 [Clostridia bacterium]|nr:hypothetical protein [Clostridia bacterium]
MKKILLGAACAALCACTALAFTACTNGTRDDAVNLKGIEASQIGTDTDCDYYLAAEPAATTKVNAMKEKTGLDFAGSLQDLYGGTDGYPQAVVVVKADLLQYSVIGDFLDALADGADWLLEDSTDAETIVKAVSDHLPDDTEPTFTSSNLNKNVIANCAVSYSPASDCKDAINSFMTEINEVSDGFGTAQDSFFATEIAGTSEYAGEALQVYAPDGAPALGLAYMMAGESGLSSTQFEYHVVASDTIQSKVTGNTPAADICILPVNLAVKLLGSGSTYRLTGTITHGNLYLLSTDGSQITASSLSTLVGKTVGCIQIGNVPGLTMKLVLKKNGIAYSVLES